MFNLELPKRNFPRNQKSVASEPEVRGNGAKLAKLPGDGKTKLRELESPCCDGRVADGARPGDLDVADGSGGEPP